LALAIPYTKALKSSVAPSSLNFAVRRCLQAMNMVKPVAFALVSANSINALGNWISDSMANGALRNGRDKALAGLPRLPRLYMAAVLVGSFFGTPQAPNELLKLL